jgi:hypothetical protein
MTIQIWSRDIRSYLALATAIFSTRYDILSSPRTGSGVFGDPDHMTALPHRHDGQPRA